MSEDTMFTIVLPTYNEKDNVVPLIDRLFEALIDVPYSYEILFVDDSSDNTPEIIREQMLQHPQINLIHRSGSARTGLATAFIKGFEAAKGKYICCMDSDLQHPPSTIPALFDKAAKTQADIVVATRYIKGGSAEGLGSLYRKTVSVGIKYLTQIVFSQTRSTTDPGSGFFVFKKSILKNIKLQPKGFKILIEILMRSNYDKKQVFEVPYHFLPRENDTSKATLGQGLEFFKHLWYIFRTEPKAARFIKFSIVGASGVVVNLGLLYLLVEYASLGKNIAWLIAVLASIFSNYFFNSIFTYQDNKSSSSKEHLKRLTYYYIISLSVMAFNFSIYQLGLRFGLYYIVSSFIAILAATLLNFLLVSKLIWKTDSLKPQN